VGNIDNVQNPCPESTKDSPETRKIISQEKYFISNKINTLKSNLSLWENNIGFFVFTRSLIWCREKRNCYQ
jgi:hypothetical protein